VALKRGYGILLQHAKKKGLPAIGVVLNAISLHSEGYYSYFGYNGRGNSSYYAEGGKK
jgi:hypothetical protein